jgi:glucosylglycerate synthase
MAETGSLPQEVKEQLDTIGTADVVIGVPAVKASEDLRWASDIGGTGQRVLIACASNGAAPRTEQIAGVEVLHYSVSPSEKYLNTSPGLFGSFYEVFQISQKAGAKCCCVWNTNPQPISADVMGRMLQPLLNEGFDLAVPRYVEVELGSLVNSSIINPIVRALYGKRIHFPMAIDLCFSSQFVDRLLQPDGRTRLPRCQQWIATEAISASSKICEVNLPMEPPRPPESTDVSSIMATLLGRLFLDLERNTGFWQKSNGSQSVPVFGEPTRQEEADEVAVDVQPMIETFQLGYRTLREIWTIALPPATFLELKRLTTLPTAAFHIPDDLWVRVVYDFALAHRQRAINREHLLRAMTPLYLAWVASYALETKDVSFAGFQYILERLALSYEKQKPYLLSRWRWPDRFNP